MFGGLHELVRGSRPLSLRLPVPENDDGAFFLDLGWRRIKYCMESRLWEPANAAKVPFTGLTKKACPRLRESSIWPPPLITGVRFTQPKASLFVQLSDP